MTADILTFPTRLRAVEAESAVWFSGGDIIAKYGAHTRAMSTETALERRAFWAEQARRYGSDPTSPEATCAARWWLAFTKALDALDLHNRVVGKPSPWPDARAEVASRLARSVARLGDSATPKHAE